jgi:hypothetical protein
MSSVRCKNSITEIPLKEYFPVGYIRLELIKSYNEMLDCANEITEPTLS